MSAGAASGGRGAAGAAAGGDDEPAAWAVDTDDEDEDGAMGWEEVELPERNEDIDPEVGGARSVQCPSAVGAPWLGAFVRFDEFLLCVPVSMDIAEYGTIESACSYQRDTWSVALETSVPPCYSYSRTLRLLQSPAVFVHGGSANQVTRPHQELCLPVSCLFYCYLCCDLDVAFALWACLSLPRRLSRPCRTT